MGSKTAFESELRAVVQELAGRPVRVNSLLFERDFLDSLKVLHLVSFLEARLGVRMPDEQITLDNFRTIRAITDAFWKHN